MFVLYIATYLVYCLVTILFDIAVQLLSCVQFLVVHVLQHTRLLVIHYLPDFSQTHVHGVSDLCPSHPISPVTPFSFSVFKLSKHQDLFQ